MKPQDLLEPFRGADKPPRRGRPWLWALVAVLLTALVVLLLLVSTNSIETGGVREGRVAGATAGNPA
jgi:hypothetical protein